MFPAFSQIYCLKLKMSSSFRQHFQFSTFFSLLFCWTTIKCMKTMIFRLQLSFDFCHNQHLFSLFRSMIDIFSGSDIISYLVSKEREWTSCWHRTVNEVEMISRIFIFSHHFHHHHHLCECLKNAFLYENVKLDTFEEFKSFLIIFWFSFLLCVLHVVGLLFNIITILTHLKGNRNEINSKKNPLKSQQVSCVPKTWKERRRRYWSVDTQYFYSRFFLILMLLKWQHRSDIWN